MRGMGEEARRGDAADNSRESTARGDASGWVTTGVAAKSLGVSPRTIRWHIEHENLEAKAEGEGVRRSWLVSIDSLQAFRDKRQQPRELPGDYRGSAEGADIAAEGPGNAIRELADRLVEEASRASEFRVRLELSERAESTLREELADERRRREEAEREREDLRRELEAVRELRESPVRPSPSESPPPAGGESQEATEGPQPTGPPRSLWRRIFGR
jgi:hypothetical protein